VSGPNRIVGGLAGVAFGFRVASGVAGFDRESHQTREACLTAQRKGFRLEYGKTLDQFQTLPLQTIVWRAKLGPYRELKRGEFRARAEYSELAPLSV
jgi:hypothetical protein